MQPSSLPDAVSASTGTLRRRRRQARSTCLPLLPGGARPDGVTASVLVEAGMLPELDD